MKKLPAGWKRMWEVKWSDGFAVNVAQARNLDDAVDQAKGLSERTDEPCRVAMVNVKAE